MSDAPADSAGPVSRTTAWARSFGTPMRDYLRTETGGAAVLAAAALAALVWANVDAGSYASAWGTELSIRLGGWTLAASLRHWVDDGLMAIFFLVVGLEARRELDLGELRERRRLLLPAAAALGGMLAAVGVFLALNAGSHAAGGWGVALSTDTAFAIGILALVGPRLSARMRVLLVTLLVVDDLVALGVIAVAYTSDLALTPLAIAGGLLAAVVVARALGVRRGWVYGLLGVALWVAVRESGVDPVVVGLLMGLLTVARPAARADLEEATDRFRDFREQPTAQLAQVARASVESALSPNERLQHRFHPWSSYVIVPLFALANAGIALDAPFLGDALRSPVTLGIVGGYVLGKPLGILAAAWLAQRMGRGALRLPIGWGAFAGTGAAAGVGFTVALLIAGRALAGEPLRQAKLGVLLSVLLAPLVSWAIFGAILRLPRRRRLRLLIGEADQLEDLALPVDPHHDRVRGPADASVTLVEYGDFECPYCGQAEPIVRELLAGDGDLRYVWRHLPLNDVHPHAQVAAEAAEAAAAQDAFWEYHALLFDHQDALKPKQLVGYAEQLGLDVERFRRELRDGEYAGRVARDVESADLSGVAGTPTFFVNGTRHHGAYDVNALKLAVKAARAKALVVAGGA
ncbi:MAG TPA: Na+/H+ antiporter NhaA [Conexibacter sp.]|jgi:Na+/H+ antiporter NhaA|nr:Na+/H+ antiporter NhaA [Conexibacter sp.]